MNWVPIAIAVAKGTAELIAAIVEMCGESTETVRSRVIAELTKDEGDATDSIAEAIEKSLPDDTSER